METKPEAEKKVPIDEQHLKELLEYTFREARQENLRKSVINYILIQFNEDSLPAVLDHISYANLLKKAVDGLFCVVYLENYNPNLVENDTVYASAYSLMVMLYSRVLGGKHYNFQIKKEEAKQNVIVR